MRSNRFSVANRLSVGSLVVAVVASALAACSGATRSDGPGGGGPGTGSVSGTVGGTGFSVASVIGAIEVASSNSSCTGNTGDTDAAPTCVSSSQGQTVGVVLTNREDATCAVVQKAVETGGVRFANFDTLEVAVVNGDGDVGPGTYAINVAMPGAPTTLGGQAFFSTTNSACDSTVNIIATSGTITFTTVTPSEIAGSYSVTFASQGTFTGSFDTAVCQLPDAGTSVPLDGGQPPCTP